MIWMFDFVFLLFFYLLRNIKLTCIESLIHMIFFLMGETNKAVYVSKCPAAYEGLHIMHMKQYEHLKKYFFYQNNW